MNHDEFLKERMTGIGGSDAAPVLGLSPFRSALEVYREKRGEAAPFEGNEATDWGVRLEPVIRQAYAERTGRIVRVPPMLRHELLSHMIAHLDGATDCRRVLEVKTARSADGWGEPGSDQIPTYYLMQVQHCMHVVGYDVADVAVLIGGQDFRMYEVPADRELQEMICEAEAEFWQRVQTGQAPEPDWNSENALKVVRTLYPGTNGQTIAAAPALEDWKRVHDAASAACARYEATADGALAHMLYEMGEAAVMKFTDGKALRRKTTKRKGYTVQDTEYLDTRFVNAKD